MYKFVKDFGLHLTLILFLQKENWTISNKFAFYSCFDF